MCVCNSILCTSTFHKRTEMLYIRHKVFSFFYEAIFNETDIAHVLACHDNGFASVKWRRAISCTLSDIDHTTSRASSRGVNPWLARLPTAMVCPAAAALQIVSLPSTWVSWGLLCSLARLDG